jgi:hypothetical protein
MSSAKLKAAPADVEFCRARRIKGKRESIIHAGDETLEVESVQTLTNVLATL